MVSINGVAPLEAGWVRVLESLAHRRDLRILKMLSGVEAWSGQHEAGAGTNSETSRFQTDPPGSMRERIAREVFGAIPP